MSGQQERSPKFKLRLDNENVWFAAGGVATVVAGALYVMLGIAGRTGTGVLAGILALFVCVFVVCGLVFSLIRSCIEYLAQRASGGRIDDLSETTAPLRSPPVDRRRLALLFPPREQPVDGKRSAADDADRRG